MSMDEAPLRELAESMGMKKAENADKQELAYYIIDNASIETARAEVAKMKPKRGRKPKAQASAEAPSQAGSVQDDAEATASTTPKKRGRKPKAAAEEVSPAVAPEATAETPEAPAPKKRGRKPKAEAAAEETVTEEPKKRGRKAKSEADAEEKKPARRGRKKTSDDAE